MVKAPPNSTHPRSRAAWRKWLEKNHTRTEGIWLISYKKATGKPRVEYEESVEEAVCFGWIDSKGNKLDDERTMLWFAPRRPGTGWSKIEAAKKDGSWNALDAVEALEKSRQETERLLPQGLQSKDHYLFSLYDGDQAVGIIWLKANMDRPVKSGFIFDVEIKEEFRGKGYGKQIMLLIEEKARELGLKSIG